jgi:cysteine-rich repeat protein
MRALSHVCRTLPVLTFWVGIAGALSGCGDEDKPKLDAGMSEVSTEDAGGADGSVEDSCSEQDDGSACGQGDMHCVAGACIPNRCGDGMKSGREACDDGNELPGDGCDPVCREEAAGCGDGKRSADEECDDGNWNDSDDCSNRCTRKRCGNTRIDYGEECDDGNGVETDACSKSCLNIRCRNNRLDPSEECDDGNSIDRDGCTNDCKVSKCGNGKVEKYETCDDANRIDDDDCGNDCTSAVCGNKLVERREVCELGERRILPAGNGEPARHVECASDCMGWYESACTKCLTTACQRFADSGGGETGNEADYVDVESGCLRKVDENFGADPADTTFLFNCAEAVDCAQTTGCSFGVDATLCYCGYATSAAGLGEALDRCAAGPDINAKCREHWERAAKSTAPGDILGGLSNLQLPAAWAWYLIACYDRNTATGGKCTRECAKP